MLTIGSLCAGGCDALSLGLEWAGLGPTIWQVEINEERRANLARHWPDADRSVVDVYDDAALALPRPSVITCSSPCQDLSSAGKRAGLAGDRSRAWFACERIIGALRPRFAVVENVSSGAGKWVPYVRSGLERFGYSTLPLPVAAADCGAPHIRRRVFVLAVLDGDREPARALDDEVAESSADVGDVAFVGREERTELECRQARPQQAPASSTGSIEGHVSDTDNDLLRLEQGRRSGTGESTGAAQSAIASRHAGWPTELEVVSPVHGVPGCVVSMLGDAPTPQQAEVVGWVIRELAGLTPEAGYG